MGIANIHALAATRNNLFGLQPDAPSLFNAKDKTSQQWLQDLGFSVNRTDAEHWVITYNKPLPELHFYSERELEQFASYKAHHYAIQQP
ncbi:hypothetical protein GCM10011533_22320 [Streptosporangium jomthongense]|uniref:Uncharacterized protein n=1 Tax=Marinobacter aromaticivorans TaxID=1494078 RepID=A0ABW2IVM3_9GAMM|nr:hypothetical protein [Marinobacter aromaticivorans]GGE69493.1 hypothetical protein GCM10011533_22320 [Streptosporangium jomthongense]